MVEPTDSWLRQQHSPLESSAFRNSMIATVEQRQHEFLPPVNPCRTSANLGLNGLGFSRLPERGLTIEGNGLIRRSVPSQTPLLTPNQYLDEQYMKPSACEAPFPQPSAYEPPCPQQKSFLIFDHSGNETRLIFSSLCPRVQNITAERIKYPALSLQDAPTKSFGAYQFLAGDHGSKVEQVCTKTPTLFEESGENEILNEGSETHEDTEEINALLYSDNDYDVVDDDGSYDSQDGYDEDEVSSGRSPLAIEGDCEKQEEQKDVTDFDDVVASLDRSSKRQKGLKGGHNERRQNLAAYEDIHGEDLICALNEDVGPAIGGKRLRKDKIRDTLRILENIIPGVKSKDPVVILDEAISYLKCLKYNAKTMSEEDPESSSCYGP